MQQSVKWYQAINGTTRVSICERVVLGTRSKKFQVQNTFNCILSKLIVFQNALCQMLIANSTYPF